MSTAAVHESADSLREPAVGPRASDPAKIIDAHGTPGRVPWRAVAVFLVIAFAGAWAAELPIWLSGTGLEGADPRTFNQLTALMMYAPAVAALVAVFAIQRPDHPVRMLGLSFRPVLRTLGFIAIALAVPPIISVLGALISGLAGSFPTDFGGQSLLLSTFEEAAPGAELDGVALSVTTVLQTIIISGPVAAVAAFGEELGWRGFLVPALRPLGRWPMLLISSAIWGVWHAPLLLLGYNFQDRGIGGILWMILFCFCVGLFITWVRIRSESVFPAAFAHGAVNGSAMLGVLLVADASIDLASTTLLSTWGIWLLYALIFIPVMASRLGRSPRARPWRLDPTP